MISCAADQLSGPNVSEVLSAVMSASEPEAKVSVIVTPPEGRESSATVYFAHWSLPVTESVVGVTVTPASVSLSASVAVTEEAATPP